MAVAKIMTNSSGGQTPNGVHPLRTLFLNENIGGHATMHRGIQANIDSDDRVVARFLNVPPTGRVRRIASVQVPGLARMDLDLQAMRGQLALSFNANRLLNLSRGTYDILHAYTQHSVLFSTKVLRAGPSVVSTDASGDQVARLLPYRDATSWTERQNSLRHRFEQPVWDAATLVVTKSEWAAKSLREDYGIGDERLRMIPMGIEVPNVLPERVAQARPVITFIGRSLRRKGGQQLLDIHRARWADRVDLHLVTKESVPPGPGLFVHSDFSPGDARLQGLLARTSVFAFPSEIDTFGYAVLEAMAAGVAVVARKHGALPEIVVEGETGLLTDSSDASLISSIERLLDHRALAERMGEAGRARAMSKYNAKLTTAALIEVLLEAKDVFDSRADSRAGQKKR